MRKTHRVHPKSERPQERMHNRVGAAHTVQVGDQSPSGNGHSVSRYHDFYRIAPVAFYVLDRQGRISELNDHAASLLSFSAGWLLGKRFVVFVARYDVKRFLDFLSDSTGKNPRSMKCDMDFNGRTWPVRISAATSKEGSLVFHKMAVVDLPHSRNTERLLEDSLSNWHSLVENLPDTIMTVEPSGEISFVNRPTWGHSVNALIGTSLLDHVPKNSHPKVLRCLGRSLKRNVVSTCELNGMGGNLNNWHSFSFGATHSFIPGERHGTGTTTASIVMVRDISEHKRTEANLRKSEIQIRAFAARIEAVREEERARVAREIHDGLGQALTVLKLDLSWLHEKTGHPAAGRKKLKSIIAQVDDTIFQVRKISAQLRPPMLDDLGLIPAIDWQVTEFRKRTGIRATVVTKVDELNLSAEASAAVFLVLQEALTNVIRHAKASRVCVTVGVEGRSLQIVIEDNGQGMTQKQEADLKSLGIVGMKERISRIGGAFTILSGPGKGTRLDIRIPA